MHFNILASTITTLKISSNNCGHFQRVGEKQIPAIQNKFQEGYKLHQGQMVAELRVSKEMCPFHNCFHYFVHLLYIRYQNVYPWAHLFQA
jgi:hypothetical protein